MLPAIESEYNFFSYHVAWQNNRPANTRTTVIIIIIIIIIILLLSVDMFPREFKN